MPRGDANWVDHDHIAILQFTVAVMRMRCDCGQELTAYADDRPDGMSPAEHADAVWAAHRQEARR